MANTKRLLSALKQVVVLGKIGPNGVIVLRKLIKDLDHGLKVKNLKIVEKTIDQISQFILNNE